MKLVLTGFTKSPLSDLWFLLTRLPTHMVMYTPMLSSKDAPQVGQAGTPDIIASWSSLKRHLEKIHWQEDGAMISRMDCLVTAMAASRYDLWDQSRPCFL